MKQILIIALLLTSALFAQAQVFEGNIKNAHINEALPFVNIGIIGKGAGTVTDDNGYFRLSLSGYSQDSLKISMIGYYTQSFLVSDIGKLYTGGAIIKLQPKTFQLKEVKVTNRKLKESVLGNTSQSQSTNAGFTNNKLGNEIGTIIKIKRSPTYLKRFNASIAGGVTDSVKLRLNFYSVKDGMPDKNLQEQNIFITVLKNQKNIAVNLEPYSIVVEDRFFVSLEWIKDTPGHGIMFSSSLFSSPIISRNTSQDKWEKIGLAGIGFNVLAQY